MRNVIGDTLHLAHEPLDVIHHPVNEVNEPVEITRTPASRQALGQITRHDALDSARDTVDLLYGPEARNHGSGDTECKHHDASPRHRIEQEVFEPVYLVDVVADDEDVIVGHPVARATKRCVLAIPEQFVFEIPPEGDGPLRQRPQVSGDKTPRAVEQPEGTPPIGIALRVSLETLHDLPGLVR